MYRSMEIRRVQITGGSSYMITLPKPWAESRGLKKNDPVIVIEQNDGGLLLTTDGGEATRDSVKTLSTCDFSSPDALYRCMIGAYIAGHDQILLKSQGPFKGTDLEAISEFTQTSMGMEIVEEDEDRILIKDLIDHSEVIPQKNVKREYLLVKRMVADALSSDPPTATEIDLRDTEVDRIHWLVQRQASIYQHDIGLSGKTGLPLTAVMSCMGVSKTLERVGDHAVLLVKNLSVLDGADRKKVVSNLEPLSKMVLDYIGKSMDSWTAADESLAEEVIRSKKALQSAVPRYFSDIANRDAGNLLRGSISRIIDYCSDIAESAINVAMEKN